MCRIAFLNFLNCFVGFVQPENVIDTIVVAVSVLSLELEDTV